MVYIYNHSGINCVWIINNSTEVLDKLHKINRTSRDGQFDSYDEYPHNTLKNNISIFGL